MKRIVAVLAATPLVLMAFAGPANAAKPEVTHLNDSGVFADAYWHSEDGNTFTDSNVSVFKTKSGTELHLSHSTAQWDGGGSIATFADAVSGFTFTMSKRLGTARLVAEDLPVSTCTYDENGEVVGECEDSTVDVALTWTGEGALTRGSVSEHVKFDGGSMNVHITFMNRAATVTGSVTGFDLSADELQGASLGAEKQVKTGRCTGAACEAPPGM